MLSLQMLVQAVDKLESMSSQRQYRAAASLLEAVTQLAVHFDSYRAVPKISELQRTIQGTREGLRRQVMSDIKRVVGDHDKFHDDDEDMRDERFATVPALHTRALTDACCVIDALGLTCREE